MIEEFSEGQYSESVEKLEKLAPNVKAAIEKLLEENSIEYDKVSFRIKSKESCKDKIERKQYSSISDIEDLCGLRIVTYYTSDVYKIVKLLKQEFIVIDDEDKALHLENDKLGYRSHHLTVNIRKEWEEALNYRGLSDFKIEIQIRTMLMHAWAAVEHTLVYKKKAQVPELLKRKLNLLSGLFEIADERLDDIRKQKNEYVEKIEAEIREKNIAAASKQPLDLDSLQAVMNYFFESRPKSSQAARGLFDEIIHLNISIESLITSCAKIEPWINEIEKDLGFDEMGLSQTGAIRVVLDLTNEEFYKARFERSPGRLVKKDIWLKKIEEAPAAPKEK